MVLTEKQIKNEWLQDVKKESRSGLHKELIELFTDFFESNGKEFIYARPADIKHKWFRTNNQISISYIRSVVKKEMRIDTDARSTFSGFDCLDEMPINGTPFKFSSLYFGIDIVLKDKLPF